MKRSFAKTNLLFLGAERHQRPRNLFSADHFRKLGFPYNTTRKNL